MDLLRITSYCWMAMGLYWLLTGFRTKSTIRKEPGARRFAYLILVLLAFAFVYSRYLSPGFMGKEIFKPSLISSYAGLIICILSVAYAIVARYWLGNNWSGTVTVKKNHELIQNGPYAITRHPIYTGIFLGLSGAALIQAEVKDALAVVLIFVALEMKMVKEEKFMNETFPGYKEYTKRTKKLIPFIY
ncbi:MAG: isoprenylcysteine carboxylmethyltransferase family protein [Chitinophagaceae bacterium]